MSPADLSPGARGVLRLAARVSSRCRASDTGVEHVLWALLLEEPGHSEFLPPSDLEAARPHVVRLIGCDPGPAFRVSAVSRAGRTGPPTGTASSEWGIEIFDELGAEALRYAIYLGRRWGGKLAPEHLFFGIVRVAGEHPDLASRLAPTVDLPSFSADEMATLVEHGDSTREVVLVPDTLAVLSIALAAAASRGSALVGFDDLLAALLSSEETVVTTLLRQAGVDLGALRALLHPARRDDAEPPP